VFAGALALASISLGQDKKNQIVTPDPVSSQWVVQLPQGASALRNAPGVASFKPAPYLANAYIVTFSDAPGLDVAASRLPRATLLEPLVARQQTLRFVPDDTSFGLQWHLRNTGQSGGTAGEDANVVNVWGTNSYNGITGSGVTIAIVDDGLQHTHPDLAANYSAAASYDYNFNDSDPTPASSQGHGTAVAGVVGARGNNSLGVSGVAPLSTLAGVRLIAAGTTDLQEANGLGHLPQVIDISSNSWGPADNSTLDGPGALTRAALESAATTGRGGKGTVFVWAAGNGLGNNDNVNYDGYANSRFTIAVSAIDHNGVQSWYAEPGAPILVTAHSNGSGAGIVTTDLTGTNGYNGLPDNNYTNQFGGTSSATPLVSGVIALMLEANPDLSYRDVQHVLVRTARKNHAADAGWTQNGAGRWVNHKYGFGAVDAQAAVTTATTWTSVGPEVSYDSGTVAVNLAIPDGPAVNTYGQPVTDSINVTDELLVEWVEVQFNATHTFRGDVELVLTSPSGTSSILAEQHLGDSGDNINWLYTSARHWDELSMGTWSLRVRDGYSGDVGTWGSWSLRIHGTAIPEPTTLAVFSVAFLCLRRSRRHTNWNRR
jgi:subtilisin family serine protease